SAVSGLIDNISKNINIKNLNCISIGDITEKKLNEYGLNSLFLPSIPNIEVLANELEQILNTYKNNIKTNTL
ncbi:MAG: hypothetical protein GXO49_07895, partial [Chlorobi bacterium]|nr:hypothetical protein [Chlorobiota bacterium]